MKEESIMVMVSKELKSKIKEKSDSQYKNMSEYIRGLVVKDLEEGR